MAKMFEDDDKLKESLPNVDELIYQEPKVKVASINQAPKADVQEVKQYLANPMVSESVAESIAKEPSLRDKLYKDLTEKYSLQNREKLSNKIQEENSGWDWKASLAALGAGLQNQNAVQAGLSVKNANEGKRNLELNEFDKGRSRVDQDLRTQTEMDKYTRDEETLAREKDPNSAESKLAKELAVQMGFKGDSSNLTAERFKAFGPYQQKLYEIREKALDRKEAREERFELARVAAGKRSVDDKKMGSFVTEGLRGVGGMRDALKKGDNTFSLVGDNDFTRSLNQMAENYGRMQSGGAINKDEEARFKKMAPGIGDDEEMQQKKLDAMELMFKERADIYGADISSIKSKQTTSKIKVSNGKETLEIDEADLNDAEKDGYKRI